MTSHAAFSQSGILRMPEKCICHSVVYTAGWFYQTFLHRLLNRSSSFRCGDLKKSSKYQISYKNRKYFLNYFLHFYFWGWNLVSTTKRSFCVSVNVVCRSGLCTGVLPCFHGPVMSTTIMPKNNCNSMISKFVSCVNDNMAVVFKKWIMNSYKTTPY